MTFLSRTKTLSSFLFQFSLFQFENLLCHNFGKLKWNTYKQKSWDFKSIVIKQWQSFLMGCCSPKIWKQFLIWDRNKLKYMKKSQGKKTPPYIYTHIIIIKKIILSCSRRKIKKTPPHLAPKEKCKAELTFHLLRQQHFKILPETIPCCPTNTSSSW